MSATHSTHLQEERVLSSLRTAGHRITQSRRAIIRGALASIRPFSAADMQILLEKDGVQCNLVTIYRELSFLEEQHVLAGVQLRDGIKRYECAFEGHFHHLVCLECDRVEKIQMDHDLDRAERRIRKEKDFLVRSHNLEFYGVCRDCV